MNNTIPHLGSVNQSLRHLDFSSQTAQAGIYSACAQLVAIDVLDTKGSKRMWGDAIFIESSKHSLLELGLGKSPISSEACKVSSAAFSTINSMVKSGVMSQNDGMSLFGQEQIFQLNLGNKLYSPNAWAYVENSPHFGNIDLNLTLSTATSESAVTSLPPISEQHDGSFETSVGMSSMPTNEEEGSASSRLIFGSYPSMMFGNSEKHSTIAPNNKVYPEADPVLVIQELPLTMAETMKNPVACTSGTTNIQRNHCNKKCTIQGCGKGARGASGRCIAHGGGRRCQKSGCQKGAEGRTIYCKAHGGGRRCEYLGCTKSAEGRTDYCIAHGGGRRCSHDGCVHAARGKSGFCIRHGGGKRCQMENCTKSAEGSSGHCISHGGGRRCQFPACTKGAQGSTLLCKAHGGGKRCTFVGCTKGAEGSTLFCKGHGGGKRCTFQGGGVCTKSVHGGTQFCVAHGGGKRCAAPDCTKSARGRTSFCVRHGGGKRCKYDGCGKSAQGSTDFCKAHGGGRRCSWGHAGSHFGAGNAACDKYARSKYGLCAAHAALLQDSCVHGGGTLGLSVFNHLEPTEPEQMNEAFTEPYHTSSVLKSGEGSSGCSGFETTKPIVPMVAPGIGLPTLPEGRVHGGGLMAMLFGSSRLRSNGVDEVGATAFEVAAPQTMWM